MRSYSQSLCALSLLGALTFGCAKKADSDVVPSSEAVPTINQGVNEGEAPLAPAAAPQAPVVVEARPFEASAYPSTKPSGEVLGGFAFTDSAGENHVIFTLDSKERDEHVYESTLHIHHVAQKDGEIRTVRNYIERVADCEFDVILKPFFGDWSVTDVNQDGVGEASFAYRVGCVSDISPVGHKAFVTQGGEKYVLRGVSRLEFPGMEPEGGTYTADTMPDVFLMKAKEVWELTVASSHHE